MAVRCRCAWRCSPPNANRGPRPAGWPTSSTRWPGRSAGSRPARSRRRSTSSCRATGACRSRPCSRRPRVVRVPDPRSPSGNSPVTILDVAADGYRLRLVDHPAAFDREGFYGDAAGDYADNAWRFGLFCRAALEALRADDRPLDVLHLHDWHTGPAAIYRDERYADDPIIGGAAMVMTLHNLAYHGWTPRNRLAQLGLRPGDGVVGLDAPGSTCCSRASSARRSSTRSRPGSPRKR